MYDARHQCRIDMEKPEEKFPRKQRFIVPTDNNPFVDASFNRILPLAFAIPIKKFLHNGVPLYPSWDGHKFYFRIEESCARAKEGNSRDEPVVQGRESNTSRGWVGLKCLSTLFESKDQTRGDVPRVSSPSPFLLPSEDTRNICIPRNALSLISD